jgi:hypothetical protein
MLTVSTMMVSSRSNVLLLPAVACVAMEGALGKVLLHSIFENRRRLKKATLKDKKVTSIQHQTISLVFCGFHILKVNKDHLKVGQSINNQVPHDYVVISFSAPILSASLSRKRTNPIAVFRIMNTFL